MHIPDAPGTRKPSRCPDRCRVRPADDQLEPTGVSHRSAIYSWSQQIERSLGGSRIECELLKIVAILNDRPVRKVQFRIHYAF